MGKHWNTLPKKAVESLWLEVFQKTKQTSVKNDVSIFDSPLEHKEGVNYA